MACIDLPITNPESEMEEGEIVDDVDQLSDISSEEEFLLRQRLQVLENYNNVLERKQAKRTSNSISTVPINGKRPRKDEVYNQILCDLSEISESDFEDRPQRIFKKAEPIKPCKRKKQNKAPAKVFKKIKDCKKKPKQDKKKSVHIVHIKSSDESDDEYFNKRRRLANAVTLKKGKNDTSTLKDRINRMLFGTKKQNNIIELKHPLTLKGTIDFDNNISDKDNNINVDNTKHSIAIQCCEMENPNVLQDESCNVRSNDNEVNIENVSLKPNDNRSKSLINLCTDNENSQDDVEFIPDAHLVNNGNGINKSKSDVSSDEDLELLREYALKTKCTKSKIETANKKNSPSTKSIPAIASEDEDSDTAELRLICLKSTLLKKAIEIKQKQKLKKRLSQSSCLEDDIIFKDVINCQSENNTDIESVDMDIGSDGEEKTKENSNTFKVASKINNDFRKERNIMHEDNELDEDEDLLRAKLLTSLSKNLPNLIDLNVINSQKDGLKTVNRVEPPRIPTHVPEEKKIIIKLGESDSEGEHEETKNLTKMHMKLAEHFQDFQSKLDTLLKSTRQEFEKEATIPVNKPAIQKPVEKFIPKTMNHLPKSEQAEYKNLVKRMAELEKIKQARNSLLSVQNKTAKETLKLRNTSMNTINAESNLEEKFALSRKKIAEESAKILKLKDEAKKLSQKYKIVATELKNISTAINLNKKQQRTVHSNLQKIRLQHQLLLKGSTHKLNAINSSNKLNKLQKENNPTTENSYLNLLKSVKVSVVNDLEKSAAEPHLSVQIDVLNNKKTIKLPKNPQKGRIVDIVLNTDSEPAINQSENAIDGPPNTDPEPTVNQNENTIDPPLVLEKGGEIGNENGTSKVHTNVAVESNSKTSDNDYKSPLAALGDTTWEEDPNAFLCPYEVGGSCRDPDCKYLHPKIPSHQ